MSPKLNGAVGRKREGIGRGDTGQKKMGEKGRKACEVKGGHVWGVRGGRAVPRSHLDGLSAFQNPG